jgi:hypothetical protein
MDNLPWVSRQWGRGKEDSVGDNLEQGTRCGLACQLICLSRERELGGQDSPNFECLELLLIRWTPADGQSLYL